VDWNTVVSNPNTAILGAIIALFVVAVVWRAIKRRRRVQAIGPMSTWGEAPLKVRSAKDLTVAIERLRAANAQWPEILSTINPKGKRSIERSLALIRQPHQFVPHLALNVIEDGCRRALARSPRATLKDALEEALRSSNIVIKAGD
jgi:hypothetical protein